MTAAALVQELAELPRSIMQDLVALGEPSPDELAYLMVAVRDARKELAVIETAMKNAYVASVNGQRRRVVPDLGEVEVRKHTSRTEWRHDDLIPALVARIMDEPGTLFDPETGELLPFSVIGQQVAARLRECVSFGSGKVTGIRDIGLQPDEFCHEDDATYSVKLPS